MSDNNSVASVSEDKFNGTATLTVRVPVGTEKRTVESIARSYFREMHGTSASKVIADKERDLTTMADDADVWAVMVSDHSSGSLVDGKEYDL